MLLGGEGWGESRAGGGAGGCGHQVEEEGTGCLGPGRKAEPRPVGGNAGGLVEKANRLHFSPMELFSTASLGCHLESSLTLLPKLQVSQTQRLHGRVR